jgi:hypothetical protein
MEGEDEDHQRLNGLRGHVDGVDGGEREQRD